MLINVFRIVFASILFCLAIFCQTCSSSQYIDANENWVAFGKTVKTGDPETVKAEFEGKPVYLQGTLTADQYIEDVEFGVAYKGLSLKRAVEYYQWHETAYTSDNYSGHRYKATKESEANTTYDYDTAWTFELIDHQDFEYPEGHENTPVAAYEKNIKLQADYYGMDNYQIAGDILADITNDTAQLDPTKVVLELSPASTVEFTEQGMILYIDSIAKLSPKVGDVRYVYTTSNSDLVSVIGGQEGTKIEGDNGSTRSAILSGKHTLEEVISYQVGELNETSNLAVIMTFICLFLCMLMFNKILKNKLHGTPPWSFFINKPKLVAAAVNTGWTYGVLYFISLYFNDFSQVPLIVIAVYLSFAAFFAGWLLFAGKGKTA